MSLINLEIFNQILSPETREATLAKAQKIVDQTTQKDSQQLVEAWCIIGECHKFNRDSQLSEEAYLKAVKVLQTSGDEKLLGEAYLLLGEALHFCQQYADAVAYFNRAAEIFKRLNESEWLVTTLNQLANSYGMMEQGDHERQSLNEALLQPSVSPVQKAFLMEGIARSLGAEGKYEEAVKIFEQALSILESERIYRFWDKRVEKLAEFYSALGDEEAAQRTRARAQF